MCILPRYGAQNRTDIYYKRDTRNKSTALLTSDVIEKGLDKYAKRTGKHKQWAESKGAWKKAFAFET